MIVLFLLFFSASKAQDITSRIKLQAQEMADAAMTQNYGLFLKYTYPKVMGDFSKEELLNELTRVFEHLAAEGIFIESSEIGDVGVIYEAGQELHCLVAEKIIIQTKEGRFLKNSYLLAISVDKGQNWCFIDCATGKENIIAMFPDFNTNMILPAKSDLIKLSSKL